MMRRLAAAVGTAVLLGAMIPASEVRAGESPVPLTVCADPNDLPYSDEAQGGFENKIARLIAADIHHPLQYVWWSQRRGFVRKTLGAQRCDLWLGVVNGMENVVSTRPYYRSTYVFVTRRSEPLAGLTLDDPRLRTRLIGVQMLGMEASNTPPAHALAERGLVSNVRGYMVYGSEDQSKRRVAILDALLHHDIDVALVWGPQAGFYARRSSSALRLEPVTPANDPSAPMTYEISMAVRTQEESLRQLVDHSLELESSRIRRILDEYGVPQLPLGGQTTQGAEL